MHLNNLCDEQEHPLGAIKAPSSASLDTLVTQSSTKAAQGALMGVVMLHTASGKIMPQWLKVALFMTGVASIVININKVTGSASIPPS